MQKATAVFTSKKQYFFAATNEKDAKTLVDTFTSFPVRGTKIIEIEWREVPKKRGQKHG